MLCKSQLLWRWLLPPAAGLLLVGCSAGKTTNELSCAEDQDCPQGLYCGADGLCQADCRGDEDCAGGGRCSARGRCYGGSTDSGSPDGGSGGPDLSQLADLQPAVEQSVGPDSSRPPDLAPAADHPLVVFPDHGSTPDLRPPDLSSPDTAPPSCSAAIVGRPCTEANEASVCGAGHLCYVPFVDSDVGICTCLCTEDDEDTSTINEDSCPGQPVNRCQALSAQAAVCFQTCQPQLGDNDCQGQLACHPQAGGLFGIYDATVCALEGCSSDADCPVFTSTPCSVSQSCPTGQTCYSIAGGNEGVCALPGNCDYLSGLCGPHNLGSAGAEVGDPCDDDTDCAGNMFCITEYDQAQYEKAGGQSCTEDWECCSGECAYGSCTAGPCLVLNRNGYCSVSGCQFAGTLPSAACGSGAACNELYNGGLCLKSCSLTSASTCRGHSGDLWGDYECRAWNNFGLTASPVCDLGFTFSCAAWASASGGDCADLGNATNSTQMSCRTLDGQMTGSSSSSGFCFDNTSSGSLHR